MTKRQTAALEICFLGRLRVRVSLRETRRVHRRRSATSSSRLHRHGNARHGQAAQDAARKRERLRAAPRALPRPHLSLGEGLQQVSAISSQARCVPFAHSSRAASRDNVLRN